jgi:hypothetical protein
VIIKEGYAKSSLPSAAAGPEDVNRLHLLARRVLGRPVLTPVWVARTGQTGHTAIHATRVSAWTKATIVHGRLFDVSRRAYAADVDPDEAEDRRRRERTEAIWHILTRNQPFAPAGAAFRLAA